MFDISGQMRLSIKVGQPNQEREFPINPQLLDELFIIQNNLLKVPTIQMTFYDNQGLQESFGIFGDGSRFSIDVSWNQENEPYRSHPFRVFSLPEQLNTDHGVKIRLLGYLDIPQYFRQRFEGSIKGSSSNVIQELAQRNQLIFEVNDTNDYQIWLSDGRSQADFLRFITNHAWIDESSCMELAVTQIPSTVSQRDTNDIPWMLRYLDLTKKIQQTIPDAILTNYGQIDSEIPAYNITEIDVKNHSGFFNHWLGYGNRIGQEDLDGRYNETEQTVATRSSLKLQMNREVTQEVGVVRREVAPINCGNTHPNFIRARHQNRRLKSQYSTVVNIMVLNHTVIRLFDKIDLNLNIRQGTEINETFQGNYLVTAKTIGISGGSYREKFELCGQGWNTDFENIWT